MVKLLFIPAIALMRRLRYAYKFALIGLMFLLPLAVVMFFFQREINSNIQFATLERQGVQYDIALTGLLQDVLLHQEAIHGFHLNKKADPSQVHAAEARIADDLQAVEIQEARWGASLKTTEGWNKLKESWGSI